MNRFSELEATIQNTTDVHHKIDSMNQLAYDLQYSDLNRAITLAEKANELVDHCEAPYLKGKADSLCNLGICYLHQERLDEAAVFLRSAFTCYQELGDLSSQARVSGVEKLLDIKRDNLKAYDLQRSRKFELLRQAGLELAVENDLDVLLRSIAWRATDLADIEECVVFLWHPEEEALRVVASTDETIIPIDSQIKPGEGMSGQVWLTGEPLVVDNYDHWEQRLKIVGEGLRAVIVVPIRWRDQMLGALNFVRKTGDVFSDADLELAELFAAQAAVAIKNTRLLNQVQSFAYDLQMEVIERKRTEAELRQYQDNLEGLVQARTDELERSNRELSRFAYVASHDLQEPLRKIQTFGDRLDSLYREVLDEKGQDYLNRMLRTAARMQTLIQDLLAFSRVMTQQDPMKKVDLNKIAADVLKDFQTEINRSHSQIEVDPLPQIRAVPVQMHQLFHNLISNALKYRQAEIPLLLTISSRLMAEDTIQLSFADNGIGFDEKYLDRIFNAFQRLHTRDQFQGTGVGLAICRHIVEQHHGRITASSNPGEGATFMVELPAGPNDAVKS